MGGLCGIFLCVVSSPPGCTCVPYTICCVAPQILPEHGKRGAKGSGKAEKASRGAWRDKWRHGKCRHRRPSRQTQHRRLHLVSERTSGPSTGALVGVLCLAVLLPLVRCVMYPTMVLLDTHAWLSTMTDPHQFSYPLNRPLSALVALICRLVSTVPVAVAAPVVIVVVVIGVVAFVCYCRKLK